MSSPAPAAGPYTRDDFCYLTPAEAASPAGGLYFRHVVNHWWSEHDERGLMFFNLARGRRPGLGQPQCSPDEAIARRLSSVNLAPELARHVRAVFHPSVWVPVRLPDLREG